MSGIFLSYSRADRAHAYRVVQGLRALEVEVYWDEDMPGVDWQYELEQRINDMAAVLVLWSKNSRNSKGVRDEARLGDKCDKLINALIDVPEPPHPFDRNNGLPIGDWDGRQPHNGWNRLVQTAEAALARTGSAHAGMLTTRLSGLDKRWSANQQALAMAEEAFAEAQAAVTEAAAALQKAAEELATARHDLAKAGEMRMSVAILRAAQQDCDAKAAEEAQAEEVHKAASKRLSEASRQLKRCRDAARGPMKDLPAAPITPSPVVKTATTPLPTNEGTSTPTAEETRPEADKTVERPEQEKRPAPGNNTLPKGADKVDRTVPAPIRWWNGVKQSRPEKIAFWAILLAAVVAMVAQVSGFFFAPAQTFSQSVAIPVDQATNADQANAVEETLPMDWLVGEWVIDQEQNQCSQRLNIEPGHQVDWLRFINPTNGKIESLRMGQGDDGSLFNIFYRYSPLPGGRVEMRLQSNPDIVMELSKCAG